MADENKNEYAAQLQNFNGEQHKHFYIVIPQIYKVCCPSKWKKTYYGVAALCCC